MAKENKWGSSQAQSSSYLFQKDFFDLVPKQEFKVEGLPTRNISTFWEKDVLPTAIKIRRIYVGNYQEEDDGILESVWHWLKERENRTLMEKATLNYEKILERLPAEVVLNFQTTFFFTMNGDFKRNDLSNLFEPFVAYQPGTPSWENDIRRTTFDYIDGLRRRPLELHNLKKGGISVTDIKGVLEKVGGNKDIVQRYEYMDTVTWEAMMKYYLVLLQREKKALQFQVTLSESGQ